VEFLNKVLFQKSVVNMGTNLYNQVPESIKKFDNFKIVKEELKSLILNHSFYSVHEFFSFE